MTTPPDGIAPRVYLREIPDDEWKDGRGVRWDHEMVKALLDEVSGGHSRSLQRDGSCHHFVC